MQSSTATMTSITASPTTITLGDTVTFTATVTATTGTPTGLVTFFDGNTPLGSGTLTIVAGNSQASLSTSLLSAAGSPHSITATYQGDATHTASTSSATSETVNQRTSTSAVTLSLTSVVVGQSSTATVTVTDSGTVPPGTADTFTPTGAPATGRTGFTSTLFADGLVLVAGGTDANNNVLQSAEIYSVSGATFSTTGNLNTARTGAVAVLLPTGKVLVAGGSSNGLAAGALNTAELFDPSAGTFTNTSQNMTAARFGATATLLSTGKVLIAGGENSGGVLNSAELYDPVADTFTATGNLNTARTGQSATLLGTGKVLVAGGSSDGTANGALNTAELFDPAGNSGAGSFTAITGANSTLSAGRWQPEAAVLLSGKVLIAGGQNSGGALSSADLYDPVANTFTPSNHSMSQARANGSAVALPNGMVLLAGGTTSQAVDLYDADSDRFDATGSLQQPDTGLVSILLNNGDVLVVGLTTAAIPASDAELYAPSFNPLGTVAVTSSEATDSITGACTLTPSTSAASTCTSSITPANIASSPHTITGTYPADAVHSTSNGTASLTVTKANTTTAVTSSVNPSVFGQSVTFTATVSPVAPGSGTPTGTVTFLDGGSPIGTGTLTGGIATFTTSALAVGNHTITTSYGGDGNFNGSTGSLTGNPQVVNKADTTTTVTSSANPSVFGQSLTFTATVSPVAPGSGTPTGTVTFLDGGSPIGTGTLTGGIATFTTSALAVGNHTITTSYGGDGNFNGSTGSLTGNPQVVNKANTLTAVTSSQNPSVFGQSVTFTATVSPVAPGSGIPTGTVTFLDGGSPIGTGTLVGGIAAFSTSALAVGNHTITTSYGGDGNFNGSTGSLTGNPQVVNKADTATSVTSSQNPSTFGQSVTFTATVSPVPPGTGTPTGTVTFLDGGSPIGTGTLTGGVAVFTTSTLAAGNHTITTSYGGDGNFNGSTGSLTGNPQVVTQAGTTTMVTASPGSSTLGDTVTLTGTVTVNSPGTGTPTGLVTFFDGTTPVGSGTLNQSSPDLATFTISLLAVGSHSITAIYDGDANFSASPLSAATTETVNLRASTTAVALSPSTVVVGQPSNITVTVTDGGTSTPPGTADAFSPTGAPATGRTGFTSTLFADGMVLVAGGTDANNNVLNSAEIYSVSGASFSATGNLNTARTGAVAVLLPNGKVLVAGGSSNGLATGALNTAELFNPATGTFTNTSQNMTAARFGTTATLLNTGKVLIAGGENSGGVLNSAELYDPVADTFTATGNLNTARTGHSATLLATGKVLVAGGSSDGAANGALNSAELFDPAGNSGAGTFTSITSTLTASRWQPEAALLLSGKVLVAGGQNSGGALNSADLYDPVANSFTATAHNMNQARANGSAVTLPTGMVLLAGGATSQVVDLYDADSDKFDTTGSLQQSDVGLVSTLLNNGDVLVVGLTTAATPAADAELYSPSFNPLGTVGLSSSEATDSFGAACVLTPSTSAASTCASTVTPSNVATSPHTITGTYPADAVHSGSTGTASLTVNKDNTTTTITAHTPNPSVVNQAVTISATVTANSPGAGTPTGSVTVSDGVGETCTITLSSGSGSCSLTPQVAGTDTLTATYSGDPNFNGSTSNGVSQTVNTRQTTTTVAFSLNPVVVNQQTTVTVTVMDTETLGTKEFPTGSVMVTSDSGHDTNAAPDTITGSPCTLTPTATTGASTCQVTVRAHGKGPNGNHTITANYPGTNVHSASMGSANLTVNTRSTQTTVMLNPSSVKVNQASTVTVMVMDNDKDSADALSPTGTVSVTSDSGGDKTPDTTGSCALAATSTTGVSTCTVMVIPNKKGSGTHTITASYLGSDVHTASSNSPGTPLTVNTRHTSTAVSFFNSNNQPITQVIIATPLTVMVTVKDDDAAGSPLPPTGPVSVTSSVTGHLADILSSGTCQLSGSGAATSCNITLTAPHVATATGAHTISAAFMEDQDDIHAASPGSSNITVNPAHASTAIDPLSAQQFLAAGTFTGQQVNLSATVINADAGSGSNAAPVGFIQFNVDGAMIGSAPVAANGAITSSATFVADLSAIGLATGNSVVSHSVTATFLPALQPPPADFSMSPQSSNSIAMTFAPTITNIPGQSIPAVSLPLNPVGTAEQIDFQCNVQVFGSLLPSSDPNTFPQCPNPPSTTLAAAATTTITINLKTNPANTTSMLHSAPSILAANRRLAGLYGLSTPLAGVLGVLLLGGSRRKYWSRRKLLGLLGMMLVLAVLLAVVGCGGGFNNPANLQPLVNGTAQGTYTVTVIGMDHNNPSNVVVVSSVQLIVTP